MSSPRVHTALDVPLGDTTFETGPAPRLVFGPGALDELGSQVRALGGRRALVVTDPGVAAAGVTDRAVGPLRDSGLPTTVFSDISPSPLAAEAAAGIEVARQLHGAVVVAVGGGSAMDAAKAIALGATNEVAVERLDDPGSTPEPGLPVIAVPTTAGTGSETNGFGVLTDPTRMVKLYPGNDSTLPRVALLDPSLTVGVPSDVTAATGMDVLTHALESLMSRGSNPVAADLALHAVRLVAGSLSRAVADGSDLQARAAMLLAAHQAGRAFASTGLGAAHAIGHALSNRVGTPHGLALAMVLPEVLRYNLEASVDALAAAADAFDITSRRGGSESGEARANWLITAVEELSATVGTDRPLREAGVGTDLVDVLAADAMADVVIRNNPRTPTRDELVAIVAACR